jgi:hypothetical protein
MAEMMLATLFTAPGALLGAFANFQRMAGPGRREPLHDRGGVAGIQLGADHEDADRMSPGLLAPVRPTFMIASLIRMHHPTVGRNRHDMRLRTEVIVAS